MSRRAGLQEGVYSMLPRTMARHEQRKVAEAKLRDIKARQRAGLPDEPLQIDPSEHDRIMEVLLREGKKTRMRVPGRPDLSSLTQEDYWQAVVRGL